MSDLELPVGPIDVANDADLAALVALAGLPGMSPRRLWQLLSRQPNVREVWQQLIASSNVGVDVNEATMRGWVASARLVEPQHVLQAHVARGLKLLVYGAADYPVQLIGDPEPPPILFADGPRQLTPLNGPSVAIVGTRSCTRYGRDIAHELGARLAARGVRVVSGLAHGIDASAHAGVQTTSPAAALAIVASGVDVYYPRGNRELQRRVASSGAVVSEWPLQCRPTKWRFPARNRLVAALSDAVVVVESGETGGSMYTVDEALSRDRAVFAVPGSVRSPASTGTNRLIADGAQPVVNLEQFVAQFSVTGAINPAARGQLESPEQASEDDVNRDGWLLELVGWHPMVFDLVVSESGRSVAEVTVAVQRLIGSGHVTQVGSLIERVR